MKTIETSRLILRPITEADAEDIFEYSKNDNVGVHAGWKAHANIEETRELMSIIFLDKEGVYGIVLKESGKMIGSMGLIDDHKRENNKARMLGYAIGEEYWGKGYTTEAAKTLIEYGFKELDLDLISAYCYPINMRSKRVLEKCGFQYEGTLRLAEERFDGVTLDNECYSIINKRKR